MITKQEDDIPMDLTADQAREFNLLVIPCFFDSHTAMQLGYTYSQIEEGQAYMFFGFRK